MAVSTDNKSINTGASTKSVSSLARTSRTTQAGGANASMPSSAGGTNIRANKTIDTTSKLAGDISKMFSGVVSEYQDASEYAGKRVGTDNLVAYKDEIDVIGLHYAGRGDLTPSDMIEKTRLEQGVYEKYMQKGSFENNEDANEAFKKTFVNPATDNLFKNKIKNKNNGFKLLQDKTENDISYAISRTGEILNKDSAQAYRQDYSSVRLNPDDIDDKWVLQLNTNLSQAYNDNNRLFVSTSNQGEVFNEFYGNAAHMDKDGKITKVDPNLTDKAFGNLISKYNSLVNADKTVKNNPDTSMFQTSIKDSNSEAKLGREASSETVIAIIKEYEDNILNNSELSSSRKNLLASEMRGFLVNQEGAKQVNSMFNKFGLPNDIVEYQKLIANGLDMKSDYILEGTTTHIDGSTYQAALDERETNNNNALNNFELKAGNESRGEFVFLLSKAQRLESVNGVSVPDVFKPYNDFISNPNATALDANGLRKQMTYMEHTGLDVSESEAYTIVRNGVARLNQEGISEADTLKIIRSTNSQVNSNSSSINITTAELRSEVKVAMLEKSKRIAELNADIDNESVRVITQLARNLGLSGSSLEDVISNAEVFHVSRGFMSLGTDKELYVPRGYTRTMADQWLDTMIDSHKKAYPDLSQSDLSWSGKIDSTGKNIEYTFYRTEDTTKLSLGTMNTSTLSKTKAFKRKQGAK